MPRLSPALQQGKSIHGGQAEVEDDGIIALGIALEPAFLAVRFTVDDKPRQGQGFPEVLPNPPIVFNHQNPQIRQPQSCRPDKASKNARLTWPCPSMYLKR